MWNLKGIFTESELEKFGTKTKIGGIVEQIGPIYVQSQGGQGIFLNKVDINVTWKTIMRYAGRFFRKGYDTKTNGEHIPLQFTPSINAQGEKIFILPQKRKKSSNPKSSLKENIEIFLK